MPKKSGIGALLKKKETLYIVGGVGVLGALYYFLNKSGGSTSSAAQPSSTTPTGSTGSSGSSANAGATLQAAVAMAQIQSNEKIAANRDAATLAAAQLQSDAARNAANARTTQTALAAGAPAATAATKGLFDILKELFGTGQPGTGASSDYPGGGVPPYGSDYANLPNLTPGVDWIGTPFVTENVPLSGGSWDVGGNTSTDWNVTPVDWSGSNSSGPEGTVQESELSPGGDWTGGDWTGDPNDGGIG